MNEIRAQALVVAEAREAHRKAKGDVDEKYNEYMMATEEARQTATDALAIMAQAESDLRDIALAAYEASQDKHPGPGVEIKVGTKLTYEPEEAFAWAKEHGLALMLNVKSFEALAKANPITCVTSEPEPKATISTDLRKALEIKEEA